MQKQSSIISGSILILVGFIFLLIQFFPGVAATINFAFLWPLFVLGVGVIFLVAALMGNASLAIPGTIISGVGSILFYQNTTGNWDFWQLWLLVPAFAGVGIILSTQMSGKSLQSGLRAGGAPLSIGLVLFFVFTISRLWPVLIILAGIYLLLQNMKNR